jgi:predicted fused transcriptional regulator/phosphomethylpyrimidine kinase
MALAEKEETYQYKDKEYDNTDGVSMEQEYSGSAYRDKVTTYNYKGKRIPVPIRWHPNAVIRRIVEHNKRSQYTGVTMIGMSGTGKTTLTNKIIHQAHVMGESYIVKRFNGHEMMHLDDHIKQMKKGFPHILVFDDASYTMEDATKSDIAKLANALTTIRHVLKSRVIIIINFHYSKATKKFFRNQHFTFMTSVSVEELSNYQEMYKDKMNVIRQFARQYNNMTLRGHFQVPVSSFEKRIIRYNMNEPFRIALVAEIADLHFMVYDKDGCAQCLPKTGKNDGIKLSTVKEIAEHIKKVTPKISPIRIAMQFYMTIHFGNEKHLTGAYQSVWKHLNEINRNMNISEETWDKVYVELFKDYKKGTPKRVGKSKVNRTMSVLDLAKQIKEEENAPPPPPPPKTFLDNDELKKQAEDVIENNTSPTNEDYDSYYTPPS